MVAHKLGLKFDSQGSGGTASFFLSCDAFFTEVVCQERGTVSAVKLIQANNQVHWRRGGGGQSVAVTDTATGGE